MLSGYAGIGEHITKEARELIDPIKGGCTPLLKGYNIRILDGNHLGKTEHRLAVLRGTSAGALPGQSLVLLDPQRIIVVDISPAKMPMARTVASGADLAHDPTTRPADRRPQLLHTGFPLCLVALRFVHHPTARQDALETGESSLILAAWRRDGLTSRPSSCATR